MHHNNLLTFIICAALTFVQDVFLGSQSIIAVIEALDIQGIIYNIIRIVITAYVSSLITSKINKPTSHDNQN